MSCHKQNHESPACHSIHITWPIPELSIDVELHLGSYSYSFQCLMCDPVQKHFPDLPTHFWASDALRLTPPPQWCDPVQKHFPDLPTHFWASDALRLTPPHDVTRYKNTSLTFLHNFELATPCDWPPPHDVDVITTSCSALNDSIRHDLKFRVNYRPSKVLNMFKNFWEIVSYTRKTQLREINHVVWECGLQGSRFQLNDTIFYDYLSFHILSDLMNRTTKLM